jgi:hypothetical protein
VTSTNTTRKSRGSPERVAGHRDAAFTVRRYTHSQPEALADAVAYLSSVVIEDDETEAAGES